MEGHASACPGRTEARPSKLDIHGGGEAVCFIDITRGAADPPALQTVLWDNTIDEGRSPLVRQ
jgi:hypothetical protein